MWKKGLMVVITLFFAGALILHALPGEKTDMKKGSDFTLTDYAGTSHRLSDYGGSRAVVLIFVATRCPVSNAYNQRMEALHQKYKKKNVVFLGINSNRAEDVAEIAGHARENGLTFPILKDEGNTIADRYEASVTPEVFLLDADLTVVYHGRIDDSRRRESVSSHDLDDALSDFLAGKKPTPTETKAFGCSIKRVDE